MTPELAPALAEHHRHRDAGGAVSPRGGFDGLVADLHAASERLAGRGTPMRKAVPGAPVVPMKALVGELEALAKSASASADAAARRAAAARVARQEAFRARFKQADTMLKSLVNAGRLTAIEVAKYEAAMARFGRTLRA